ncbi:Uncharacterized protein BP5553_08519 [Venustampulla echinocandica]|uniref:DUF7624 domain-containing protein n=1 Tax=Venustampulla echinocandica TaxID=2656787 RepID=A0A370TEL0_9HELO|nr:Uncharacterized protein BP5553_08519 [Venustampulla echinocandica]RDL33080.1 Uncharacterized protein BP5553_08519 [Venustampulla echinocandica]
MALESPLAPSPGNIMSAFSPYTDFSLSPNSPAQQSPRFQSLSARSSAEANSLHPHSVDYGLSPNNAHMASPSDMVGPSPVTSNGTETTEIDDEAAEDVQEHESSPTTSTTSSIADSVESQSALKRLSTNLPEHFRTSLDDESISVIHAPEGFGDFNTPKPTPPAQPPQVDRSTPIPYHHEETSPSTIKTDLSVPNDKVVQSSPISPPPISTDVAPVRYALEDATPRAQTRQEVEALVGKGQRSSSANSLAGVSTGLGDYPHYSWFPGIPEDQREVEEDEFDARTVHNTDEEINALKTALHECWTLCNTLASLSSIHRERIFSYSGTGDAHEKAWKCCWKLCQKLYDSRDEDHEFHVRPTLELCRDFCQALFDVRQRKDEIADSVLRVSFELNNHLFNTHDRSLPEAFRERTLDFYITLCHRLMKQRNELAEETDALLRACWSLAEMLFSLRQNKRDGKAADEELLGSAVQACWELCDLFREGWTQVRPERGTPRPSQTTFAQASEQMSRSSHSRSGSLPSLPENPEPPERTHVRYMPETPTTEFEDTPISPEENSPNIPNILVLGTEGSRSKTRWSSATSSLSTYSQGSQKSSSTITSTKNTEDVNLTRLKVLILKAAMNVGFSRTTPTSAAPNKSDPPALQAFVKSLPTGSFGSLPSHAALLTAYRTLVLSDPTFRSASSLPSIGKKANAADVAKSVGWMMNSGRYTFLKDLFKLVFGFHVEEAETRKNVSITV